MKKAPQEFPYCFLQAILKISPGLSPLSSQAAVASATAALAGFLRGDTY